MRAGTLRHRVTLQNSVLSQDGTTGEVTQTWSTAATVWADVRYLNGLEVVKSDLPVAVSRCSIRIRYRAGVTPGMRAVQDATVFDIKSVLVDESGRRFLDMVCEHGKNDG